MFEDKLQYVVDRFEVTDTLTRYFMAMDKNDWELARSCLTDPVTFTLAGSSVSNVKLDETPVPLDEFMKDLIARNGGFSLTLHIHPNPLVTIDGDKAHITSYQIVPHSVGTKEGETFWCYGFYEADLERSDNGWLISRLVIDIRMFNNVDVSRIYEIAAKRQAEKSAKD